MNDFEGPASAWSAPTERSWEALLLGPDGVVRQLDTATGCGPACLAMALGLEAGPEHRECIPDQTVLAARCREASAPDLSSHPHQWATSPAALARVLNIHRGPDRPRRRAPKQYHIVHAASPRGPMEEILSWLRPPRRPAGHPSLPSFFLAHHGTHWMLAVGAKVGPDGLAWLAMADPTTGRLRGLTAAGVNTFFTPNLVGQHPDWANRRLAIIPSAQPRQPPHPLPCTPCTPSTDAATPVFGPTLVPLTPFTPPTALAPALSPPEENSLLEWLVAIARSTDHPIARDWLAPLHHAQHIVTDPSVLSLPADTTRRVWVLDATRLPVAQLLIRGTPAILLEFTIAVPPPTPSTIRDI